MRPLTVLHLHRMGDPVRYRESVHALEHMIATQSKSSVCFVHDADLPLPDYVRQIDFDLIVLGPTFLCVRYDAEILKRALETYGFIAQSRACKIALPQDDYDCAALLDRWFVDWKIDVVYTVCPTGWNVLYPEYIKRGTLRLGFTGYIFDDWIEQWREPRPHADRQLDVAYRASQLPANFGSLGQLKSDIVPRFKQAVPNGALVTDVSTDLQKMIPGKAWHQFLESARACLITPSGSSLLDPEGLYRQRSAEFVRRHPSASFEDVAAACFPGEDGRHVFTAISPRNIEAALSETVQLAVPSDYSGILQSHEHYIPLAADCSNMSDVLHALHDRDLMKKVSARCKEVILSHKRLRARVIVDELLQSADEILVRRNERGLDAQPARALHERYAREMQDISARYWGQYRRAAQMRRWLKKAGLGRLRDLLPR